MIARTLNMAILLAALAFACAAERRISLENIHEIESDEQLSEWITYYYEHPRPDLTISSLKYCEKKGFLSEKRVETPSIFFIFEEVLRREPSLKKEFLQAAANGGPDLKRAVAFALLMTGSPLNQLEGLRTKETAKYFSELEHYRPLDLLSTKEVSPTILDAFWAAFFVNGDERYVARIAEYVDWFEEPKYSTKMLIGGAARWSLASNCVQHPRVLAAVKELAEKSTGKHKKILDEIVRQAEKELTS